MSRTTYCHVRIVTPVLPGQPSRVFEWGGPEGANTLPGLIGVEVAESVDGLVNHFALTLAPAAFGTPDSIAALVPQYSLVEIHMAATDDTDDTAIVGLTDAAHEAEQWSAAGPHRSITIPGRGIECVLADANVWWAPYLETHALDQTEIDRTLTEPFLEQLTGQLAWSRKIIGEDTDPRSAVLCVLLYYLLNHASAVVNLLLPDEQRIRDLLLPDGYTPDTLDAQLARFPPQPGTRYDIPRTWTFIGDSLGITKLLLPTATLHPQPGPVLNALVSLIDREFHEFFVRYERDAGVGRSRARMIHRIKPFAGPGLAETLEIVDRSTLGRRPLRSRFNLDEPSLETVEITSADVLASNLAHGMRDVRNVYLVSPGQSAFFENGAFKAMVAPKYAGRRGDWSYIGRFSVRPLEHVTPHFVVGRRTTDTPAIIEASEQLADLLRVWYDPHPVMLEGTIQVVGRNAFRSGQRLIWRGLADDMTPDGRPTREFYVRAVQKRYDCERGAFTAALQVERGWTIADAPAAAGARRTT